LLVLDTDHFSEWERALDPGLKLRARIEAERPDVSVSVITVQEQLSGWLAEINRQHNPLRQVQPYDRLRRQIESLGNWTVLPFDEDSARLFTAFRQQGIRIGSMDLKIACIALAYDVTLLTRNRVDFAQVPGLKFENWLD